MIKESISRTGFESQILVFKTNIKSRKRVRRASPILNAFSEVSRWTVDIQDIDNVLRVVTKGNMSVDDVILKLREGGFYCETLED